MNIIIRTARPDELSIVESLVCEAYEEFRTRLSPEIWKLWAESIGATLRSGKGEVIVAEEGGAVAGAVQFFADTSCFTKISWPEGAATMRVLSVRPGRRGLGIGRKLVTECLARGRACGASGLYILTTGHMAEARELYVRMGFRPCAAIDLSVFSPEEQVEAYRFDLR